jgi:hypothetical protein
MDDSASGEEEDEGDFNFASKYVISCYNPPFFSLRRRSLTRVIVPSQGRRLLRGRDHDQHVEEEEEALQHRRRWPRRPKREDGPGRRHQPRWSRRCQRPRRQLAWWLPRPWRLSWRSGSRPQVRKAKLSELRFALHRNKERKTKKKGGGKTREW